MKKIIFAILIAFTFAGIGVVLFVPSTQEEAQRAVFERESGDDKEGYEDEEVYVYETEADGPDDCTSNEAYDEDAGVCYFECSDEEECAAIHAEVDAELDELSDEYVESEGDFSEAEDGVEPEAIATYRVNADETISILSGNEASRHQEIWRLFARISPDVFTKVFVQTFEIADDASDDTLAYVHDEDGDGMWALGVNLGSFGKDGKREDILTLIHEFAHIVTLNQTQVTHGGSCITYDTGDGCANTQSYLYAFVKAFWSESDRRAAVNGEDIYSRSSDRFATEYAATSPEEDIAESFALFVLRDEKKTDASVASQKIAFFRKYPALVELRLSIRKGLGSVLLERKRAQR
jgi:hypothetical protein